MLFIGPASAIIIFTELDLIVSDDPITAKTTSAAPTHPAVKMYLRSLSNVQLREVGLELGLCWPHLKNMKEDCMLDEMLDSWLRGEDAYDVIETSGHPSWQKLVKALKEAGHTGVAAKIKQGIIIMTLCQNL